MKIFLNNNCESFTGRIGKNYGYYVCKRKKGYYLVKNAKGFVPPVGHICAIFALAIMAKARLHIADVECSAEELHNALYEAHHFVAAQHVWKNFVDYKKRSYCADDLLNLKTTFGL